MGRRQNSSTKHEKLRREIHERSLRSSKLTFAELVVALGAMVEAGDAMLFDADSLSSDTKTMIIAVLYTAFDMPGDPDVECARAAAESRSTAALRGAEQKRAEKASRRRKSSTEPKAEKPINPAGKLGRKLQTLIKDGEARAEQPARKTEAGEQPAAKTVAGGSQSSRGNC